MDEPKRCSSCLGWLKATMERQHFFLESPHRHGCVMMCQRMGKMMITNWLFGTMCLDMPAARAVASTSKKEPSNTRSVGQVSSEFMHDYRHTKYILDHFSMMSE